MDFVDRADNDKGRTGMTPSLKAERVCGTRNGRRYPFRRVKTVISLGRPQVLQDGLVSSRPFYEPDTIRTALHSTARQSVG